MTNTDAEPRSVVVYLCMFSIMFIAHLKPALLGRLKQPGRLFWAGLSILFIRYRPAGTGDRTS